MELKQYLEAIDSKQERICRLSDEIWGYAETAFSETRSAKALADCLRELLTVEGGKAQVREGFCIRCGHCAAVCPADAIRLSGCPEEELLPYEPSEFDIPPQKLLNFLKFRRSVRQFQSRPVDADMLTALLEAARYAPTGGNQQMNRYILLEERRAAVIQLVLQTLYDAVQRLDEEPALQELRPYQVTLRPRPSKRARTPTYSTPLTVLISTSAVLSSTVMVALEPSRVTVAVRPLARSLSGA